MDAISTSSIKVPEPNISSGSASNAAVKKDDKKEKAVKKAPSRQYQRPNVGVLNVPNISKTPLSDTYQKKQEELPFTKYKIVTNRQNKKELKLNSFISLGIILTGILALFKKK